MRKFVYALLFVNLAFVHCKSGDEAPPESNSFVSLLGLNLITTYGWKGQLVSQTCSSDVAINGIFTCPAFNALEQQTISYYPENANLILNLQNNRLTGYYTLILPHYNLLPTNIYQITASLVMEQGYDSSGNFLGEDGTGYQPVMKLAQIGAANAPNPIVYSSVATPSTTSVDLIDFAAQEDPHNLSGTMKLRYYQTSNPTIGALLVTYGFKFDKSF